jgi:hypothetical protein
MPLVRYVLFTGGILLGLFFWTDWYFPKTAVAEASADVDRTIIRIHSSHRWPAAMRFDTSAVMPQVAASALADADIPAAAPATSARQAYAYQAPPAAKAAERTAEKPRRHVRSAPRSPSRETPRVASTQPNWFSW